MAGGGPRSFRDQDTGKEIGKFGILFQRDPEDLVTSVLFGFGRLEFVDVVTVRRKKREGTDFRGFGNRQLQNLVLGVGLNGDGRNPDGYLAADFVKESLQVDIVLGLGGNAEIQAGFAGKADLLADEPVQIGPDFDLCGEGLFGRRGNFRQDKGFHLVAVRDERGEEDFFGKRELQGSGGVAFG